MNQLNDMVCKSRLMKIIMLSEFHHTYFTRAPLQHVAVFSNYEIHSFD